MEYQGIITGIGDKALGKNLIMPELDAYINKFIIGKNTIIEGLYLNYNEKTISAGACILCGFRGIIEESQTFDTYEQNTYIYGKFVLHFDKDIQDEFYIETTTTQKTDTNVNPIKITEAGIYYLLLYTGLTRNPDLDTTHPYPVNAQRSIETDLVKNGAEIESDVEGYTQPVNDNTTRIATTEYVHRQIEEEIDYDSITLEIKATYSNAGSATKIGEITIERKAKYCIGKIKIDMESIAPAMLNPDFNPNIDWGTVDSSFIPTTSDVVFWVSVISKNTSVVVSKSFELTINTSGKIVEQWSGYNGSAIGDRHYCTDYNIGYQCQ